MPSPASRKGAHASVKPASPPSTPAALAVRQLREVLMESHREDTSHAFRLGLLQGALSVAMPQLELAAGETGIAVHTGFDFGTAVAPYVTPEQEARRLMRPRGGQRNA